MEKSANDSKTMEQKDMISRLNMVISSRNELNVFDEAKQETRLPEEEAAAQTVIKEHTRSARHTNKETFKGVLSRNEIIPLSDS